MPSRTAIINPAWLILATLLLNGLLWLWSLNTFPAGPVIILHYNTVIGIDFTGESKQIITLPQIGLLILLVNTLVGYLIRQIDQQTAWTVWGIIPVIQIILIGAFYLIWQMNL